VFQIRICPDPKLFGLKDPDPILLISDTDLDPAPAPDPDPSLFTPNLGICFKHAQVVSDEKEGGRKTYQSIGVCMGPWRWTFFLFSIQLPPFFATNFRFR